MNISMSQAAGFPCRPGLSAAFALCALMYCDIIKIQIAP